MTKKKIPFSLPRKKAASHKEKFFINSISNFYLYANRHKNNDPTQNLRDMKVVLNVNF